MSDSLRSKLGKIEKAVGAATRCPNCADGSRIVPVETATSFPMTWTGCPGCGGSDVTLLVTGLPPRPLVDDAPAVVPAMPPKTVKRISLAFEPRAWQREVLTRAKRYNVIPAHRRAGKSVLGVALLLNEAMLEWRPLPRFAFVSPLLNQGRDSIWGAIKTYSSRIPATRIHEADLAVELANGATLKLYGASDPDRLRGVYFDGVIIDEIGQMPPELLEEVLMPTLADRRGWLLAIGTPRGVNAFSGLFDRALRDPDWYAARFTVDDTGALAEDELKAQRAIMSEAVFRQEFQCDFSAANDDSLIALDDAYAAAKRVLAVGEYSFAPIVLGCDVARFGDDSSVIIRRQGLCAFEPIVMKGADTMEVADAIAYQIRTHRPDACFIDQTGVGGGVVDRLRQLGHHPIGIDFAGKSSRPEYANKRAQIWVELRDWLRDGGRIPDNQRLINDLASPSYFFNGAGRLQLESKDDLRAKGTGSPDLGDALALTFSAPVMTKRARLDLANRQPESRRYVPPSQRREGYR